MSAIIESLQVSESVLVADIGDAMTTICLFDIVDGAYRLISRAQSPTTSRAPWLDTSIGMRQAISRLSEITGRSLLDSNSRLIQPESNSGEGVDRFVATVCATSPLRVLLVGLLDEVSLASARRALGHIFYEEVDHISLADNRTLDDRLASILNHKPELIFIAGGTDDGDSSQILSLVDTVALGIKLLGRHAVRIPQVIYAGNRRARDQVSNFLSGQNNLHIVENIRPELGVEKIFEAASKASELFEDIKIASIPGIERVTDLVDSPAISTPQALQNVTRFYATLTRSNVLALDVSSNNITMIAANPAQTRMVVRSDLGLGEPLANLLDKVSTEDILRWLDADEISPGKVASFLKNRAIFPHTLPMLESELKLEQAITREMMRIASDGAVKEWEWPGLPAFRLVLLRGAIFSQNTQSLSTMLMLLDGVQPSGIFAVALDQYGVLPPLGAISLETPVVAVQSLEGTTLNDLGWVIAPYGQAQPGKPILKVKLESDAAGAIEIDVEAGTVDVLPLPVGEKGELTVKPLSRRIDVGKGPGATRKLRVYGGTLGLIIDARGRPFKLPADAETRRQMIRKWQWEAGGT